MDDAGVLHGDLNLSNVLLFKKGADRFTAKLCDFGSAMIFTDFNCDRPVRQATFTPPWDGPESEKEISLDDLYKVGIYCYGLLLCRIFLESADPFGLKFRSEPPLSQDTKKSAIRKWKQDDGVLSICRYAIRNADHVHYTASQLKVLDGILDITVRTAIELRAAEYEDIKDILKPGLSAAEAQKRLLEKAIHHVWSIELMSRVTRRCLPGR